MDTPQGHSPRGGGLMYQDLAVWLLERINERDQLADRMDHASMNGVESSDEGAWVEAADSDWLRADCQSKRLIIAEHRTERVGSGYWCETCNVPGDNPGSTWCLTLRLLALPYASHPGYRTAWRTG